MSKVSLRRLLAKLTALALSTSAVRACVRRHKRRDRQSATDDLDLDDDVPIDREHVDPVDAAVALGRSLALALGAMRPARRHPHRGDLGRVAGSGAAARVAHALEWAFPLVGDAVVIDHLSRDRGPRDPGRCGTRRVDPAAPAGGDLDVLDRLADDPDPTSGQWPCAPARGNRCCDLQAG